jgi:hypothetical protein
MCTLTHGVLLWQCRPIETTEGPLDVTFLDDSSLMILTSDLTLDILRFDFSTGDVELLRSLQMPSWMLYDAGQFIKSPSPPLTRDAEDLLQHHQTSTDCEIIVIHVLLVPAEGPDWSRLYSFGLLLVIRRTALIRYLSSSGVWAPHWSDWAPMCVVVVPTGLIDKTHIALHGSHIYCFDFNSVSGPDGRSINYVYHEGAACHMILDFGCWESDDNQDPMSLPFFSSRHPSFDTSHLRGPFTPSKDSCVIYSHWQDRNSLARKAVPWEDLLQSDGEFWDVWDDVQRHRRLFRLTYLGDIPALESVFPSSPGTPRVCRVEVRSLWDRLVILTKTVNSVSNFNLLHGTYGASSD